MLRHVIRHVVIMTTALNLLCSTSIFAAVSTTAAPLPTQVFEPDHYLSYDIKAGPFFTDRVTLRDQFIAPLDFIVERPIKLLNPTLKRHNNLVYDIKYPRLHYTAYQIRPLRDVAINAKVLVFNQFGQFFFDEFRPSRLLAPTRKIPHSTSTDATDENGQIAFKADHYLCYDIPQVEVKTEFGYLKDQFRSRGFDTLIATRFCNPVAKLHDGRLFDVIHDNEANHLLCFELQKKKIFKVAALIDQFGNKGAVAFNDDELCVPSVKIKLTSDECEGSLPDFDGQCNGLCPNPTDLCLPDAVNQFCRCFKEPPTQCVDMVPNSDGQCNGECPFNQVCIADLTNDSCHCREIIEPCRRAADGICGGSCPIGDICIGVPGTNECDCIPS